MSVKDNFSVADEPVRSCSKILGGYIAPYDSTVVERIRSAGAVLFGRVGFVLEVLAGVLSLIACAADEHGRARDGQLQHEQCIRTGAEPVDAARGRRDLCGWQLWRWGGCRGGGTG